ncbi:MAG: YcbK family protein [Alphaproteobacteria bacterium]
MITALFALIIVGFILSLWAIGVCYLKKKQYLLGLFSISFIIFALMLIFWVNIKALFPYSYHELGGEGLKPEAYEALNKIRISTNRRWDVFSGYRSAEHNKKVGGASNSQHVQGVAFDVRVPMSRRAQFYKAAKAAGFTAYGWGNRTVHIDMGPKRWWTYDNQGRAASGTQKMQYLNKAPDNFKEDFGLK